jgi:hypothetical protein
MNQRTPMQQSGDILVRFVTHSVNQLFDTQCRQSQNDYEEGIELPTTLAILWVEAIGESMEFLSI